MSGNRHDHIYVDSTRTLGHAIRHARKEGIVGIDTEFIHRRTYYPLPALYQMQVADQSYLIDPLSIKDMEPFKELVKAPEIIKVMHGCQSDLDLFSCHLKIHPQGLFDTQVAAPFVGFDHLSGYQALVARAFDVELAKSETMSDWLQRPLSSRQLEYACDDVIYLPKLHQLLQGRLKALKRTTWFEEEMARQCLPPARRSALYYRQYKTAWKLKGAHLLRFQRLCRWREEKAKRRNQPRQWVVSDKILFQLARTTEWKQVLADYPKLKHRYGCELARTIAEADAAPRDRWPKPLLRGVRTSEMDSLEKLRTQISAKAESLDIPAALLGNKKMLSDLLIACREGKPLPVGFQGWRLEALGRSFIDGLSPKEQ